MKKSCWMMNTNGFIRSLSWQRGGFKSEQIWIFSILLSRPDGGEGRDGIIFHFCTLRPQGGREAFSPIVPPSAQPIPHIHRK
jgi:hypothetical protein